MYAHMQTSGYTYVCAYTCVSVQIRRPVHTCWYYLTPHSAERQDFANPEVIPGSVDAVLAEAPFGAREPVGSGTVMGEAPALAGRCQGTHALTLRAGPGDRPCRPLCLRDSPGPAPDQPPTTCQAPVRKAHPLAGPGHAGL